MTNREYILNTIAKKVATINDLKKIKEKVKNNTGDTIKLKIQTVGLYYFADLIKENSNFTLSNYSMGLILDEAINKEKEGINKLIDKLIEEETKNENNA